MRGRSVENRVCLDYDDGDAMVHQCHGLVSGRTRSVYASIRQSKQHFDSSNPPFEQLKQYIDCPTLGQPVRSAQLPRWG